MSVGPRHNNDRYVPFGGGSADQAEAAITEGRSAVHGLRASATTLNDLANGIAAIGAELTGDSAVPDPPAISVEHVA